LEEQGAPVALNGCDGGELRLAVGTEDFLILRVEDVVGIVGESVESGAGEHDSASVVGGIGAHSGSAALLDGHLFGHRHDVEYQVEDLRAGVEVHPGGLGHDELGRGGLDGIVAGREAGEGIGAGSVGAGGLGCARRAFQGHFGSENDGAAFIGHLAAQDGGLAGERVRGE
jgi:hypothetical protein